MLSGGSDAIRAGRAGHSRGDETTLRKVTCVWKLGVGMSYSAVYYMDSIFTRSRAACTVILVWSLAYMPFTP